MTYYSAVQPSIQVLGENPRISEIGQADYRRLRDLRSAARDDERKQESQYSVTGKLRIASQWQEVAQLAAKIIADVGKDIEVAVWLIEAETRVSGYAGMVNAFTLLTELITVHHRMLHPQPEEEDDHPFEMISSLNGVGREGTLIQALRLLPLVDDVPYGDHCLWSTQTGSETETANAILAAGVPAARARLADLDAAKKAVSDCDTALTELLGRDAPPFSKIQEVLEDTASVLMRLSGALSEAETNDGPDTNTDETAPIAPDSTASAPAIRNREDAFDQLLRIARFFRHAEPHSPISDTLETLVRRGRMDFLTLIEELIPDPNARAAVMTTAGIGKDKSEHNGGG